MCILCLAGTLALAYAPMRAMLVKIEPWTADWRTMLLSDRAAAGQHPAVALVLITDQTLASYSQTSPTPRDLLAKIIRTVDAAQPRAIGLDFYYDRTTEKDGEYHDAIASAESQIVLGAVTERAERFDKKWHEFQHQFLTSMVQGTRAAIGFINLRHDRDDVVRYTSAPYPGGPYPDAFALQLARAGVVGKGREATLAPSARIAWLVGPRLNPNPFLTIPAHELWADADPQAAERAAKLRAELSGKVVLVSVDRPYIDRHRTPFSAWAQEDMPGVLVHAQITAQIIDGRGYVELDGGQTRVLLAALLACGALLSWVFWQRRIDFLSRSAATGALIGADALFYSQMRIVLPFTLALVAWVIGVTGGHHLRSMTDWAMGRRARTASAAASNQS